MRDTRSIASIRGNSRIWAVGAVHGDAARLTALHEALEPRLEAGDTLVYLGNYLGHGPAIRETVSELLRFRRLFLARPPLVFREDIVYLRGSQEEMWRKLLQLQFAGDARSILDWVLSRGVDATLEAYGGDARKGRGSASGGALVLNEWTRVLREAVRQHPGHEAFMGALVRAAVAGDGELLFVNCGLDPERPLSVQTDTFWWAARGFESIAAPYENYRRVIRGYDPAHGGFAETPCTVTVDGGCGFDGALIALCLSPGGDIIERIDA
jgi:serine/threonine protein phosphatase 1